MKFLERKEQMEHETRAMQDKKDLQENLYKELHLINDNFRRVKKNELTNIEETVNECWEKHNHDESMSEEDEPAAAPVNNNSDKKVETRGRAKSLSSDDDGEKNMLFKEEFAQGAMNTLDNARSSSIQSDSATKLGTQSDSTKKQMLKG